MKSFLKAIACLMLVSSLIIAQRSAPKLPMLSGPYLGQKPPGMKAEIFALGLLSTDSNEFNAAFTPDGKQLFFTVTTSSTQTIMLIEEKNGFWQDRAIAPFSGFSRDVDPFVTYDGQKLYFSSTRKIGGGTQDDCDIWFVERNKNGNGWSTPQNCPIASTPNLHDFYLTLSINDIGFFSIFNEDDKGDIYSIRIAGNIETSPKKLGYNINTIYNDHDPFISPNERFLIFTSDRPGGFGSADLYISFKSKDGSWSEPINMGSDINSDAYDFCPIISPDGKYLFFSSSRSGNGDIYWISVEIIDILEQMITKKKNPVLIILTKR